MTTSAPPALSSPEEIEKVSSDNIVIAFDLLSSLTYMSCLAIAQLPREAIFRKAGEQPHKTAVFFQQVFLLAARLGMEYTEALQSVAGRAKASNIKSLLLRFASTISSGESEGTFIKEESRLESRRYIAEYQTSIENLKKWTDAYAALLVSVTLIVVVALVSAMTGGLQQNFVVLMGMATFFITAVGVYLILRTSPYEEMAFSSKTGMPPDRRKAKFLLMTLGGIGLPLAVAMGFIFGLGAGLLTIGLMLFPTGYFAARDAKKISGLDQEISTFLRTLGATAGAKKTTLGMALPDIDLKSMGGLEPHILRLKNRIANQLPPSLCWEQFAAEAGSELVRRSTGMLVEAVELGGDAGEIGDIASTYASSVAEMRGIRRLTAGSFTFLAYPMHAAMTGLLMFIMAIISTFNAKLEEVSASVLDQAQSATASLGTTGSGLDMFQTQDLGMTTAVVAFVVLVLTVANALAPKFAAGGHNLTLVQTFSITSIISGVNFLVIPRAATNLFAG
ncbi:MAG: hypothetical protein IIC96_02695 [Chloroflexi bacterium]|nr:hypothetical protein [Chloroflexota bacterium]MCH8349219.1 hypothetical protein [Chloroflexota bacterium]